jgi:hypothetical protein
MAFPPLHPDPAGELFDAALKLLAVDGTVGADDPLQMGR